MPHSSVTPCRCRYRPPKPRPYYANTTPLLRAPALVSYYAYTTPLLPRPYYRAPFARTYHTPITLLPRPYYHAPITRT